MRWKKRGQIFASLAECGSPETLTHGMRPTPLHIADDTYDIYFTVRDPQMRGYIYKVRFDVVAVRPVQTPSKAMHYGKPGTFDDCGCLPASIIKIKDRTFCYYTGVNVRNTVPFSNDSGLAALLADGTMQRVFEGPVLGRRPQEPYFCAAPFVIKDNDILRVYYTSCTMWKEMPDGSVKHYYHIKYAESQDGVTWNQNASIAIDYENEHEYALCTPCVLKFSDADYAMWYTYRAGPNILTNRIGYAESPDGLTWTRMDHKAGIDVSPEGWDSEMICYPYVFKHKDRLYMLYNGNGYGKTGFGLAVLEEE